MGTVYLVGAGPGDPGLLTVRAANLLARADVVVYDALVNPRILERCAPGVELIFVGKRGGQPSAGQNAINDILVASASRHARVVRLKGGDPFVFGRGGEEALALRYAGITFEVVPGVTAGVAAAAYAGIPVTHRGVASSVVLTTGHEDPTKSESDLDWDHLARGAGTLVFYMGVARMAANFARLRDAGRPETTPAAVIESGTYPLQRTVVGTLATLPALAKRAGIGAPALVIVGSVVSLREQLAWFDRRPLSGKTVVVTRARSQASEFSALLEAMGAAVAEFPTICIAEAADPEALRGAAANLGSFEWVVFTSANGVEHFWSVLNAIGADARSFGQAKVCAIGPATGAALGRRGIRPDLIPGEFVAEAAVEALAEVEPLSGKRILLPQAEAARAVLREGLRSHGALVTEVAAYRTLPDGSDAGVLAPRFQAGEIDVVTFTASSTVHNFVEMIGTDIGSAQVACIGPITSRTARELGLPVHIEATDYTIRGLALAISRRFGAP